MFFFRVNQLMLLTKQLSCRRLDYWHGKYECQHNSCQGLFDAKILERPSEQCEVQLFFECQNVSQHPKAEKRNRLTGSERIKVTLQTTAKGISNYRNELILSKDNGEYFTINNI